MASDQSVSIYLDDCMRKIKVLMLFVVKVGQSVNTIAIEGCDRFVCCWSKSYSG